MPAPKLFTNLPERSNSRIDGSLRWNIQIFPCASGIAEMTWPHSMPEGSCAQFSTGRKGFGRLFVARESVSAANAAAISIPLTIAVKYTNLLPATRSMGVLLDESFYTYGCYYGDMMLAL